MSLLVCRELGSPEDDGLGAGGGERLELRVQVREGHQDAAGERHVSPPEAVTSRPKQTFESNLSCVVKSASRIKRLACLDHDPIQTY